MMVLVKLLTYGKSRMLVLLLKNHVGVLHFTNLAAASTTIPTQNLFCEHNVVKVTPAKRCL